jgi:hypothetical protein
VQLVHSTLLQPFLSPVHFIADVAVAPAAAVTPAAACNSAGWEALVEVTEPVLPLPTQFRALPRNPYGMDTASMASAYNRVLACYMAYGPDDTETQDALVAALGRDPSRWVPVLLAGGALAVPELPPLMAMGSKEEASVSGLMVGRAAQRCCVCMCCGVQRVKLHTATRPLLRAPQHLLRCPASATCSRWLSDYMQQVAQ